MTRVDFYILPDDSSQSLEVFACKLTEKAYAQGLKIYIHTQDEQQTQSLNSLLWTFKAESFLPHEVVVKGATAEAPIMLGHTEEQEQSIPEHTIDVLINLNSAVPLFFSQFERVVEIVNQDKQIKENGRDRFRFYKDRGYQIHSHDMTQKMGNSK